MMEAQLKTFLFNLKSSKLKTSLWKKQPDLRATEDKQNVYKNLLLQIAILENALVLLNEYERFIIETHLIHHKTWEDTAQLFEEKWGLQNGRSDRTYKRIQARALQKISAFISSIDADEKFETDMLRIQKAAK